MLLRKTILPFLLLIMPQPLVLAEKAQSLSKDSLQSFVLTDSPIIGQSLTGQTIKLGGFSGLRFLGKTADGKLEFLTHTDRGPNTEAYEEQGKTKRPFLIPHFNPRLVILTLDPERKTMKISKQIFLKGFNKKRLSGLPQDPEKDESPVDLFGKNLAFDSHGMDLEGIDIAKDGSYWMVEEYGPSILHFSSQGQLLELFYPGQGLPAILAQRGLNRGFEGIALAGKKVYAIMQSALDNGLKIKQAKNIRIIEFDIQKKKTSGQFFYPLEDKNTDRIGDMLSLGKGRFLVIEQNNRRGEKAHKKVFLLDLTKATNLQGFDKKMMGSLDNLSVDLLKAEGINVVQKQELLDLAAIGIQDKKIEGLSLVGPNQLAVIVDNDFNLSGELDRKKGIAGFIEEKPRLYIISF